MTNSELICTLWVCPCCMLSHANGECCPDDTHGGDSVAPWSALSDGETVTMGGDVHGEYCERDTDGECDCEIDSYSKSQCDGCGSWLHGERHAFTLWRKPGVSLAKVG